MHERSENFNKNRIFKKYHGEITELKHTTTELSKSIEGFSRRLEEGEERICKLEGRAVEFIHSGQNRKRMNKSEDGLRDLRDNIKWTNIHI